MNFIVRPFYMPLYEYAKCKITQRFYRESLCFTLSWPGLLGLSAGCLETTLSQEIVWQMPPPHKMFNCRFALVFYEIKVQFVRFLVENIQKCTEMINITRIINSDEIIMSLYSLLK